MDYKEKTKQIEFTKALLGEGDWGELYFPGEDIPIIINPQNMLNEINNRKLHKKIK